MAIGIQNSFVTKTSNAVIRIPHLTGLFTDIGIDLSQLLFHQSNQDEIKTKSNIRLRAAIISSFFGGGLFGGYLFTELNFNLSTLFIAAFILILSLVYDDFKNKSSLK